MISPTFCTSSMPLSSTSYCSNSFDLNFNSPNIHFNNDNFCALDNNSKNKIILYILNTLSILDSFHDFCDAPKNDSPPKNETTEAKKIREDKNEQNKINIKKILSKYCIKIIAINRKIYETLSGYKKIIIDNFNKISLNTKVLIDFNTPNFGYLTQETITYSWVNDKRGDFFIKYLEFIKNNLLTTPNYFYYNKDEIDKSIIQNFKTLFSSTDETLIENKKNDIIRCRNILYEYIKTSNNDILTILLNELNIKWIVKGKIESKNNITYPSSYILDMYPGGLSEEDKNIWADSTKWNFSWYLYNKDNIDPNPGQLSFDSMIKGTQKTFPKRFTDNKKDINNSYFSKMNDTKIILGDPDKDQQIYTAHNNVFTKTNISPYIEATINNTSKFDCDDNEINKIAEKLLEELNKSSIDTMDINYISAQLGFKRFGDWFQISQLKSMFNDGYFILKTGDIWCIACAIFVGCPCLYNNTLYNINYKPNRKGIDLYTNFINPTLLKDTTTKVEVKFPQEYKLSKGYLSVLINKYLKYKSKYLKQKNQLNIDKINNIITSKKKELYNNIDNINYKYIKQKYLKYKNKYLLLNLGIKECNFL